MPATALATTPSMASVPINEGACTRRAAPAAPRALKHGSAVPRPKNPAPCLHGARPLPSCLGRWWGARPGTARPAGVQVNEALVGAEVLFW